MLTLTLDRKKSRNPVSVKRAERIYSSQLVKLASHVGQIIGGFPPADPSVVPTLSDMLRRYAEALKPWAAAQAAKMIAEVNQRDIAGWKAMGGVISAELQREILTAPTGETFRKLQAQQVELIQSIPLDAAKRVHELTIKGLEDSRRADAIAAEIMRSGEVAKNRAMLIARTEVSRAASNLTEARARHVGSDGYIWRTSKDGDVRPSHKAMAGKLVQWGDPPTLDGMTGHAGCLPNCRCWAEVLLPD